jgi:DNA-directed RNA polymerase subunit M/transcription elongation factor TFIIS
VKNGRDDIQWPKRVSKHKIRRLYESDAQGMLDTELVDDVGITLLLRCKSILEVAEAKRGHVRCPRCARQKKETIIQRTRVKGDPRDEVITCPECGWQVTWGEYAASYKRKQLNIGGAAGAFEAYVQSYEAARTSQAKMLAIDRLIHEFHYSLRDRPGLPTRSVGPNLIQGKLGDILTFLDELTYGPDTAQEMREQRAGWLRNLETNQRLTMGEGDASDISTE